MSTLKQRRGTRRKQLVLMFVLTLFLMAGTAALILQGLVKHK
jgi:hypothetical protein